jgi:flagellar hook-associated protein 2
MAISNALSSAQITALIQQASAAYLAPANALQAQEKPIGAEITDLGKVQGALSSLQSALAALADISTLAQRTVTVSPSDAVSATATNTAAAGTYNLTGIHLAQSESLISSGSSDATATLGSGSITIQVGAGSATTIAIASGQSSLNGIATAIDQANVGVKASVLYDGSSYHLVLTGSAGTANAFTVSGSGALARLSYSAGASGGLHETQAASNAAFSLNGVAISSGSNTITGVVPGLTLTLAASGSATVQVTSSVDALDQATNSVVTALNGVLGTLNQYASYNSTSGAGPLFGDVGLQVLRSSLLNAISRPGIAGTGSNSSYNSLGAVGFSIASDGTVALNDAAFQSAAQTNYQAVASLLGAIGTASNPAIAVQDIGSAHAGTYAINITANANGSVVGTVNGEAASGSGGILVVTGLGAAHGLTLQVPSGLTGSLGSVTVSQGLFASLSSVVSGALASGSGSVTTEIGDFNSTITSMNQQIGVLQQQAQQETLILTQQYSNAEATLSQLSTVSDFLNSYFNLSSGGGSGG